MLNINKTNNLIKRLLTSSKLSTKIYLYMSYKSAGSDYDSYEKNYTFYNLNPKVIRGYVSQLSARSLVWRQYGLDEQGAVQVVTESKYRNWFEKCNKIKINNDEYEVFKEGVGGRVMITDRPFNTINVILTKKKAD